MRVTVGAVIETCVRLVDAKVLQTPETLGEVEALARGIAGLTPFEFMFFAVRVVDDSQRSSRRRDALFAINVALARTVDFMAACSAFHKTDSETRVRWRQAIDGLVAA